MSEKYEELARSARCLAGSTTTPNWNAAKSLFQATCTPYKIMEITDDFDRVTTERDALAQNLRFAEEGYVSFAEECDKLQQRLTAADERADVLEGLLRGALRHVPHYGKSDWQGSLRHQINEALKPAEGGGDE